MQIEHKEHAIDWNFIMPIMEKINKELYHIVIKRKTHFSIEIRVNYNKNIIVANAYSSEYGKELETYYNVIIEFILYYNNKRK